MIRAAKPRKGCVNMTVNNKRLVQEVPGLAIQLVVQKKNYKFVHGDVQSRKVYTVGGLYSDSLSPEQSSERTTNTYVEESVWVDEPSETMRSNLGSALSVLPEVIQAAGGVVLDDELKEFHHQVKAVKGSLRKGYPDGVVPARAMAKAEEYMSKYNLEGYTLKVIGIRVSNTSFPGSRKRSDGLFEARECLRSVYVNRLFNQEVLAALANKIARAVVEPILENLEEVRGYAMTEKSDGSIVFSPTKTITGTFEGKEVKKTALPPGVSERRVTSDFQMSNRF